MCGLDLRWRDVLEMLCQKTCHSSILGYRGKVIYVSGGDSEYRGNCHCILAGVEH